MEEDVRKLYYILFFIKNSELVTVNLSFIMLSLYTLFVSPKKQWQSVLLSYIISFALLYAYSGLK